MQDNLLAEDFIIFKSVLWGGIRITTMLLLNATIDWSIKKCYTITIFMLNPTIQQCSTPTLEGQWVKHFMHLQGI